MVQMQRNRDPAVLAVLLDSVGNVVGADLLVFQSTVCEIGTAAHEGVGQIRALNDGGGAEHFVDFDDGLGLGHGVDVERALCVVILFGPTSPRPMTAS